MGKKTQKEAHLGLTLMRDRFKGQRVTRDKDSQALVCRFAGSTGGSFTLRDLIFVASLSHA
jgi:hypothetical protein